MKFIQIIILTIGAALMFVGGAIAGETKLGDLIIQNTTIRATPPKAPVSGGYMTIKNTGSKADRLIGGSVSFAKKVEVHEMKVIDDIMKMREVAGGLEIPAGGEVTLKPGSYHIMFMKLQEQMNAGEKRAVTLKFQNAGEVEIEFDVIEITRKKKKMKHSKMDQGKKKAQEHSHDHSKMISLEEGAQAPTLAMDLAKDAVGGWNLHIITTNFKFSPETVNNKPVDGEGHAHLYANGTKLARVYGPWFHIGSLPSGKIDLSVTLNANDHSALAVGEKALSVSQTITVQ